MVVREMRKAMRWQKATVEERAVCRAGRSSLRFVGLRLGLGQVGPAYVWMFGVRVLVIHKTPVKYMFITAVWKVRTGITCNTQKTSQVSLHTSPVLREGEVKHMHISIVFVLMY